MSVALPLSGEPRHQACLERALGLCVRALVRHLGDRLRAVILTGSFARGEGTVLADARGLRALSDLEFFVVLRGASPAARVLPACAAALEARLAAEGLRVGVEFGPLRPGFFRRARPSIFVFDLREHGRVLWGPPDLLEALPRFGPEAIPPEDALWLLCNRIVEQLELHERLALGAAGPAELAYGRVKLLLDLAGSLLAFVGRHVARYAERPAAFARLVAETPSLRAALPADLVAEVARAARAKVAPAAHDAWPPVDGGAAEGARLGHALRALGPAVTAALGWELARLLGARGDLDALLTAYARRAPLAERVRDWARLWLTPLPPPVALARGRALRLALRSTPRRLLYAAAARAYRALADGHGPEADPAPGDPRAAAAALVRDLPLASTARPVDPGAARRAIVALWRWAVRTR